MTIPQVRGMYNGDRARKEVLVEFGFRLPSALDNRPLMFHEFEERLGQVAVRLGDAGPYELTVRRVPTPTLAASQRLRGQRLATPPCPCRSRVGSKNGQRQGDGAEQLIRPTGLLDPRSRSSRRAVRSTT